MGGNGSFLNFLYFSNFVFLIFSFFNNVGIDLYADVLKRHFGARLYGRPTIVIKTRGVMKRLSQALCPNTKSQKPVVAIKHERKKIPKLHKL